LEGLTPPRPLASADRVEDFRSGEPALDQWLARRALVNETTGASRTFVITDRKGVIGFHALATGAVAIAEAPGRVRRNMPDPIPVVVLARMAVDTRWRGRGLGRALVRDAILRACAASEIVGVRALLVHAKSDAAHRFYVEACGFSPSPLAPMTLMVNLADARAALTTSG
jgi:GNAT superfamily N-acetyltransferase